MTGIPILIRARTPLLITLYRARIRNHDDNGIALFGRVGAAVGHRAVTHVGQFETFTAARSAVAVAVDGEGGGGCHDRARAGGLPAAAAAAGAWAGAAVVVLGLFVSFLISKFWG